MEQRIEELFHEYDKDGSGFLEATEIQNLLCLLNIDLTDEEFKDIFKTNVFPEKISKEDFMADIIGKIGDVDCENRLRLSLQEFDEPGTGVISKEKLKDILTGIGKGTLSDEDVEDIFQDIDIDKDGEIQIEELVRFVYKKDAYLKGDEETADTQDHEGD